MDASGVYTAVTEKKKKRLHEWKRLWQLTGWSMKEAPIQIILPVYIYSSVLYTMFVLCLA